MSAGTISAGFAARIPRDSTSPVPVSSAAIESLWFHKNAPQPVRLVPVRISPSWSIKGSIARSATSCLPSRAAPTAGCTIDFSRENAVGDLIEEGSCRYTQDSFMNRCSEENGPRFELGEFHIQIGKILRLFGRGECEAHSRSSCRDGDCRSCRGP